LSTKNLHEQFSKLIKTGKDLLAYDLNADTLAKKKKWQVQCIALLERAFEEGNVYVKEFKVVQNYGNPDFHLIDGAAIMEGAKEDLDFRIKSDKLDKIEGKIQKQKVEAERRATVVESKLWGSVIELIDMQREELKKRGSVNQAIIEIRKELKEIKSLLTEFMSKKEGG
jgi:hypothetical protein